MKKRQGRKTKDSVLGSMSSRLASAKTAVRKALIHLDQADALLQANLTAGVGVLTGDEKENLDTLGLLRALRALSTGLRDCDQLKRGRDR